MKENKQSQSQEKVLKFKCVKLSSGLFLIAKVPYYHETNKIVTHKNELDQTVLFLVHPHEIIRNSYSFNDVPMDSIDLKAWIFPVKDIAISVPKDEITSICDPLPSLIDFYNEYLLKVNFINREPELAAIVYGLPFSPDYKNIKFTNDLNEQLQQESINNSELDSDEDM